MLMKDTIINELPDWNKGENKGLNMTAEHVVNELSSYEIDFDEVYGMAVEDFMDECSFREGDIYWTENGGRLKYDKGDNTYNCSSPVVLQFHTFKDLESDNIIVITAFHRTGDVRGNYTSYMALEFDYEEGFIEALLDIQSFIEFYTDNNILVSIAQSLLDEDGSVRIDLYKEDGEYIDTYEVYVPIDCDEIEDSDSYKKAFMELIQDNEGYWYDRYVDIREALGLPELDKVETTTL